MAKPGDIDLSGLGDMGESSATEQLASYQDGVRTVRRFRLLCAEGTAKGRAWESQGDTCSIGSHESNDLVLEDSTVSRFHCEVHVDARGAWVRDLESRNGTLVDGMRVMEAWLRPGSVLRLGRTVLRFQLVTDSNRLPVSERTEFGSLVGRSIAMRATFAVLERAAQSDATVLLEGETGTGKEAAAESLHRAGARRDAPFLVLDCGAIPANLLESELFGHEKGAFTGATERRRGVFEAADRGTVFLDEIGELATELQPKLLRVLERREVRRVGSNTSQKIDVRVIAGTNRDLRAEVNAGRFRPDLYFRLAVVRVGLPALRERPEDVPLLVERLLAQLGGGETAARLSTPEFLASLSRGAWPGNVRELRNYLERCLVLEEAVPLAEVDAPEPATEDPSAPYAEARKRAIDRFERNYLAALMRVHGGNVAHAAEASGMNRVYLYRLLHRHGLMR